MSAPRWIWGAAFVVSGLLHASGLMIVSVNSRPSVTPAKPTVVLQRENLFKFKAAAITPVKPQRAAKPVAKSIAPAKTSKTLSAQTVRTIKAAPKPSPVKQVTARPVSRVLKKANVIPAKTIEPKRPDTAPTRPSPVTPENKTSPKPSEKPVAATPKKPLVQTPQRILSRPPQPDTATPAKPATKTPVNKVQVAVNRAGGPGVVKSTPLAKISAPAPVIIKRAQPVKRQKLAALPLTKAPIAKTVPQANKPRLLPRSELLARYISAYRGGRCFYALPLNLSGQTPQIIGFGNSIPAFLEFSGAVEQVHHTAPQIGMRMVSRAQCPVIDFTQALLSNTAPQIDIFLKSANILHGKTLQGLVAKPEFQHLAILLVDDEGKVHNIAGYTKQTSEGIAFHPQVFGTGDGRSRVQLIVAIASQQPLPVLQGNDVRSSKDVFPLLLRQIQNAPGAVKMGLRAFVVQ